METKLPRPRGRPRKRKRPEDENGSTDKKASTRGRKRIMETRSMGTIALVGRYVLKEFEGNGIFLGKIVYYDTGLYRVEYEDGDREDLESRELRELILGENDFDGDLDARKKKLDELLLKRDAKKKNDSEKKVVDLKNEADGVETSTLSELSGGLTVENDGTQVQGDVDSSGDSCEHVHGRDMDLEVEAPLVPPPELPPSSGTIAVPEESVSHLFSVYGFLRSFGIQLFLSPFGLDDFVGALNFGLPNSLLDAIHVALMRVLRRHLDRLSSDGSEVASKCLRYVDWNLLDALTWPVYLAHYFHVMGYIKGLEWKEFYECVMDKEYYSLPADRKLIILQILCDDVLDSAELRPEIDMREESEVGIDPDAVATYPPENGPRRVHPRYAKTSACRYADAMEIGAGSHDMKSSGKSRALGFKGTEGDADAVNVDLDANNDECRLCGMDGTLLCCDGCPSAYHSRCIGVLKMYIPGGSWYCPECTINNIGPTITVGTSLRGADVFGVDLYGQIFLGTCNHLLVMASISAKAHVRYYNLTDIAKVVQVLLSSAQHRALYSGICKAILEYWDIPESVITLYTIETGTDVAHMRKGATFSPPLPPLLRVNQKGPGKVEAESASSSIGSHLDSNACLNTSLDIATESNIPAGIKGTQDCLPVNLKPQSAMSTGSFGQQGDPSDVTALSLVDKSSAMDLAACTAANRNETFGGNGTDQHLWASLTYQSKVGHHAGFRRSDRNSANLVVYIGSCFKPQAYINHYMNGDFAASAAGNLAALSSEESHVFEAQKSGNARKAASSIISLQMKAFSSTASRFFWPSSEKKDIVRERCGWCHSCKLPASSRRGCMLNAAVTSATKSATKFFSGLLPLKNGEGSLSSIAAYILYLEESLHGLVAGPFFSESHRNQWRKQVEEASTCSAIKVLLLELGENICSIALSGDWVKLMDDCLVETSIIQSASCTMGIAQKRGLSGKRQRKQSEVTLDGCNNDNFSWWRGGKLSKYVLQKAILPCSMVRKAARKGGIRRISGFNYSDDSELPKRSRQLAWRAAVERSKNASQLALQVRYLDIHVRWSDLVRPEQILPDGKGLETETSVFRNANISNKKVVDNKIRYGVTFGNQKHLPSRVMKNVIDVERSQDETYIYWFPETRIPLYLIKEYEEILHQVLLTSAKKPSNALSKLQRKQLKASRQDIFSYLMCKRDKSEKCCCASCELDVSLRNTVTCSACKGYCHKDCTLSSISTNGKVELLMTCKRCYHARSHAQNEINKKYLNASSPLSGQEHRTVVMATKDTQHKAFNQPLTPVRTHKSSEVKHATSCSSLATKSRSRICSWGVIWRKKNNEDTGIDFRRKNILLRGSSDKNFLKPVCDLCQQPYNSTLSYIHCETCKKWYHAEAVELDESRISDVVGFKCCKCRRIGPPECPYMDHELREQKRRKRRIRAQKQGQANIAADPHCGTISESKESKATTSMFPAEDVFVSDDDPLLLCLPKVEETTENNSDFEWNSASGPGLQKLPIRRNVKHEGDVDGLSGSNLSNVELSDYHETNSLPKSKEEKSLPVAEWDVSLHGLEGEVLFDYENLNYEDMEFEPQTYFSFTELLASDDGGQCDGFDASSDASKNVENQTASVSHVEQCGMSTHGQPASTMTMSSNVSAVPCKICSHVEPVPDLCCEICGLWIHSHCSPWEELLSEGSWKCGGCREWQ